MSDLPASFYRAESAWLNPPETTPEYDEWADAQDEKKSIMKKAEENIGNLPSQDISSYDELDEAIGIITNVLNQLKTLLDELGNLIDTFPDYEPDPDTAYDDSFIRGAA